MTSESSQLIPALPVRRRGTLEIFDTALKLYRRYFWVLLGWSALVSVIAFVPFVSFFALFTTPLLYGAVSCCVAAAVRGQKVNFTQCWQFSKPRYGAMLGTLILGWLIFSVIILVIYVAFILMLVAGIAVLNWAPEPVQVVMGILGFLIILVLFSVLGVVAFGWLNMVPIVVCLEDDKRGTAAMGRAFDLLKGHWRRVFGMSLIIGLAMIAVMGIVGGGISLLGAARWSEFFSSEASESAIWGLMLAMGTFIGLFAMLWNPAQSLIISVLYLDLRVRREALDLEWTAYASTPPAPSSASGVEGPVGVAAQTMPQPPTGLAVGPETLPASFAAGGALAEANTPFPVASPPIVPPPIVPPPGAPPPGAPEAVVGNPTLENTPPQNGAVDYVAPPFSEPSISEPVTSENTISEFGTPSAPVSSEPVTPPSTPLDESGEPFEIKPFEIEPFEIKPFDVNLETPQPPQEDETTGRSQA